VQTMRADARLLPMATALMVGLVVGGLADSALVAGLSACVMLALITAITSTRNH
jgi:hypothetical protein